MSICTLLDFFPFSPTLYFHFYLITLVTSYLSDYRLPDSFVITCSKVICADQTVVCCLIYGSPLLPVKENKKYKTHPW